MIYECDILISACGKLRGMQHWKKGTPLSEATQSELRNLLRQVGDEKKVAKMLEVSPTSVMRGAIGFGMRRGTIALIEQGLRRGKAA